MACQLQSAWPVASDADGVVLLRQPLFEQAGHGSIVFGDKNDAGSEVSRHYGPPEAYAVLDELGTRPRVRYFPKLVDKNPELA